MSPRRLLHLYPFMTPRASILRRLPPVPAGLAEFRVRHGRIVGYHAGRDHVCASLYWFGDFDPWVDRTLRRLVRPGETALDVGANIGATTLVLARSVGAEGKVVAFEPHPDSAALLRANVLANGLNAVDVVGLALSDSEGSVFLEEPAGQPGMSALRAAPGPAARRVQSVRLDDWLASSSRPGPIAACKIDVEGHEASVFAGMPETLRAGRIAAILFERHFKTSSPVGDEILELLAESGYETFRIEKSPLEVRYVPAAERPRARPTSDHVAVHKRSDAYHRLGL